MACLDERSESSVPALFRVEVADSLADHCDANFAFCHGLEVRNLLLTGGCSMMNKHGFNCIIARGMG